MAVDYEWRLRVLMAENGIFRAIDLAPRLAEHGIRLSDSQVWRLVTGRPLSPGFQARMQQLPDDGPAGGRSAARAIEPGGPPGGSVRRA